MNPLAELLGKSPALEAVRQKVEHLVQRQTDARRLPPILILGETGTGKGLLARAIHQSGPRRNGPFVDVNCAAIPETLLEAEMFGFERGAFTDARQAKVGLFQAAHRGTIFLDEIGLLPEALQAKLLKVIEEQAVRRLGSTRSEPVDVWIVAATSEDLAVAARGRRFREDLYHRLAVLTLSLPPLRERGADIPLLAEHFLARASADYRLPPKRLDARARATLEAYAWPGNIRELSNVMERVALLSEAQVVTPEILGLPEVRPAEPRGVPPRGGAIPLEDLVGNVEQTHLLQALTQSNWNISRAAARLGLSRNTLRYRVEKYGLRPGAPAAAPRRRAPPPPGSKADAPAAISEKAPAPISVRWERRRLTVLRADLVPPPGERPSLDPSRQLELIIEKVKTFGGRVEELSPTGIVAVFGLEPIEDAPKRAALTAVAIQKAVEHALSGHGQKVETKVAIHAGDFLVGFGDETARIDLEAKRQAWTFLEALMARAEPDALVVSGAAALLLERHLDLVPVGVPQVPAGQMYRLTGLERTGLGPGGRMTRFVGRQHELELVESRLALATRGQGQVVGVVGEAGIGKSRLLHEFRQRLIGKGVTYLEGSCVSYGRTIPHLPLLDILRMGWGITDTDSPETIGDKVRGGLADLGMNPEEGSPYLLHLLGIKEGTESVATLSPEVVKVRMLEALRQLMLRWSQHDPLVLVVADLHWVDEISEEYFVSLVEVIAGARILLVSTYRPGYRPRWMEKSYATQIALGPLTPQDGLDIMHSVFGTVQVPDSLVQLILSKAEGNPFFLEELARAVREEGGRTPIGPVPDTIQEVLLARIDRLPPQEKRLLQAAAVIGKDVRFTILQVVAQLPEDALGRSLIHLKAAELLYETTLAPETEYTFKHVLTQEVAYGSILENRRQALHARIVEAVEQLYPDRLSEHVERLAHHAFRGEVWDKALAFLRQAGAKTASRSAHREAVVYFEQALAALKHLPERGDTVEQAIDLRFDLRNSLHLLGEFGRILGHLREAQTLAETLGEQRRLGWIFSYLTQYFRNTGDQAGAIESGQRALTIAENLEDFTLQVATHTHLGPAYDALGDRRQAIDILTRTVESLKGNLSYERFRLAGLPSVICRANLAWCLAELGEFAEGIAYAEEGIRIAETIDDPYTLSVACFGIGTAFLVKGEFRQAVPALERGVELCRTFTLRLTFPAIASCLGSAYALSGQLAQAVPLLEQALEQAVSMQLMNRHSIFLARLGEAYLLAGRPDDSIPPAEHALRLSRERKERGHEAYALRLLGEITSRDTRPHVEKAEAYYRQAIALAEELGMRPLLSHCHWGLGTLYRRTGQHPNAEQHLAVATRMFRQMDMQSWSERVERG